jgi:TolB-like protein/class 3 adenylate cyclase/Tfp pilus assembly protein PilF
VRRRLPSTRAENFVRLLRRVSPQDTPAETKPDLPLEIAHLSLIDVVGYSKLLVNEQVELLQELNRIVRSTQSFRAAEASGKLIRVPTGDGMALLFFHSPEEPVRCALEISEALQGHSQIKIRMGVHSGPINPVKDVNDQTNIAGSGINVGQRVLDCADAGHILLSGHVAEDLTPYRHWRPYLNDLGECEVKHGLRLHLFNLCKDGLGNPQIPEKLRRRRWMQGAAIHAVNPSRWPRLLVAVALVVSAIALAVSLSIFLRRASPDVAQSRLQESPATSIPEKSIAVLPFENRSEEKANAYFADGIQDEILARLSKIADLKVISRTSTQHYKSAPENLREIAKQLGVANILEGSVQRAADQVRVNVQLINAQTDSHLWAEIYDRKLTDILGIESEIATRIAESLRAKLTGREAQELAVKPTTNPEAYDAYLRGLAYTLKTTVTSANYLAAQKYLRESVRLDPKFALSWALLSYVDSLGYLTATLQPTATLREEARRAAETALSLQPNLGEALVAEGYYHYACLRDYDTAIRYFERARQLLPNNSSIPESLAYVTRRRGQWDRSESYFNEAEHLDPRNVSLLTQHACSYIMLRRFPEALRKLDEVLNITPDDVGILAVKAAIAQAQGDLPLAAALLKSPHSTTDDSSTLGMRIYQATLERDPAQIIPRVKEELAKSDPASGFQTGELRFWLGWAQDLAGDHSGAQQSWRQARGELEPFLKEQPENFNLVGDLALTNMGLGDKAAALALVEQAIAAMPIEKDAIDGQIPIDILARVAAQTGEPDRAIAALQKLLSIPSQSLPPFTPALLRLDPMFDPLRNDPRFQKLCELKNP